MNLDPGRIDRRAVPLFATPTCVWPAEARLGEGLLWSASGQVLYWVDILAHRLHRLDPVSGERASWGFATSISALAEREAGPGLVVTLRDGFALFDPDDPGDPAEPRYLHRLADEPSANRFNDGKCDARGRFWAGTMDWDCVAPTGSLYVLDAHGACCRHALGFAVTNGPTWSLDGRTLFFNDTVAGTVFAWDFDAETGCIDHRREWLRFAAGDGYPDGMTTDASGRLWIAHWGAACVSSHDPATAREVGRVALPVSQVTNCAFGGAGLSTLYITSARAGLSAAQLDAEPLAGGLFAVDVGCAGLPAARFGVEARWMDCAE